MSESGRERFRYHPFYCEENAWHLCRDLRQRAEPVHVLWVSNARRQVAVFEQRPAEPGQPVVWDYHVLVVTGRGVEAEVWDLDSRLSFPCPVTDYLERAFAPVPEPFRPRFRRVAAPAFLDAFASDRRHMKGADGSWLHPPPPWPPIGTGHRLDDYLDLEAHPDLGEVLTPAELARRYS